MQTLYLIVKAKYYDKIFISAAHKFCDNIENLM